ncbi:hypothetical protein [Thermomonospora amylolytica]|uniref:hypothetical protein n=1 Tax=Thermomonospora amylolytica TaxID=1411117 RepID=UPI000E6C2CD9|nr:hypothetical protein [Thermomonospora amylolytica]
MPPATTLERVHLPGNATSLAAAGGEGPVYALCGRPDGGLLCAVDLDGALRWSREVVWGADLRVAPDGGIWFTDRRVLCEVGPDGTPGRRIEPDGALPEEMLGAFVILDGGFLVAWGSQPYRGVRVERLDGEGKRRWSTELPVPGLSYRGVVEMRIGDPQSMRPMRPWTPTSMLVEGREGLLVSGDRALATFFDSSSGIGLSHCLDVGTGEHLWTTPPMPTGDRAIAGPGSFYIGAQGYDAFEMSLYDRDGRVVLQWPSHGRPLVSSRGRTRVIELENVLPSRSRVRRLHRDASMTDGPVLPGYYTVGPVLSSDGRAAFFRDGRLQTVDPDLNVRTLHTAEGWEGTGRMLLLDGGLLAFTLTQDWKVGSSRFFFARTDLAPIDTGVWPCGEGNLQGNPVR